ncbi:tyrosine-type recombinase/integrase [Burkholderia thailandensis]|nr:tyrosine-type recombinase/integrase [Burkholderia thailandensis]MUV23114.1 tyrosine-type recombinase/integrase [Burkholderia thailandensis]MUV27079.1 tyrosine-type recombinase/integrase [Burkholderia thailandensis]NBD02756.1 tyrosine-type recombinase/integrase [Burkholderia thailandensis]NBJ18087.1 tyrosine-type recombinase/integrase [Burkholderia thailandensis]
MGINVIQLAPFYSNRLRRSYTNLARINFTAGRVRDFRCPPDAKQIFMWDSGAPGLGLRATAGSVSYVFQGRIAGNTVRTTIGDARTWDIDGARQKARELQKLIDEGKDPRVEKAAAIAVTQARRVESRRRQATLDAAWKSYIDVNRSRWSDHHVADHEKVSHRGGEMRKRGRKQPRVRGALSSLLDVPLPDLTADVIAEWLKREAESRPTQASLAFRLLRACLNWCAEQHEWSGLVPEHVCRTRKVRQNVPKVRAKSDCLQREQLAPWFDGVRQIANPVVSAFLQALLLTGARREEMSELKWADLDFRWNTMMLRDKVEGDRTIPLTPYVGLLLGALPRRNEWVFSSVKSGSGRLQAPDDRHRIVLRAAHLEGLTLHGLRRSFSTLTEWIECPAGVVAQIMGHKPSATAEKHYKQRPIDLLRMWHTKIEAWILNEAGITLPATQQMANV